MCISHSMSLFDSPSRSSSTAACSPLFARTRPHSSRSRSSAFNSRRSSGSPPCRRTRAPRQTLSGCCARCSTWSPARRLTRCPPQVQVRVRSTAWATALSLSHSARSSLPHRARARLRPTRPPPCPMLARPVAARPSPSLVAHTRTCEQSLSASRGVRCHRRPRAQALPPLAHGSSYSSCASVPRPSPASTLLFRNWWANHTFRLLWVFLNWHLLPASIRYWGI